MINVNTLKKLILKKEENLIVLLEGLNCHGFNYRTNKGKKELRFALPNHKNISSGVIYLDDFLGCTIRTPEYEFQGNLFGFIQKIKNIEFGDTVIWICSKLNIRIEQAQEMFPKLESDISQLSFGNRILQVKQKALQGTNIQDIDIELFDIDNYRYVFCPYIDLIKEGISAEVQRKFHIGFDLWSKRILYPHRYWNAHDSDENFIGIIGRTTNKFWEELGIPKYFPLKSYEKRNNLYGLYENLKEEKPNNLSELQKKIYRTIKDDKYIVIYEAEKSVLKRATWNDFTGVALMGHQLHSEQIKIINQLQDVHEVIFALDKDISEEKIKEMCRKIHTKSVSYIIDKKGLLGPKDSPADASQQVFWELFCNRVRIKKEQIKNIKRF
jgi:hypothetical protein